MVNISLHRLLSIGEFKGGWCSLEIFCTTKDRQHKTKRDWKNEK